MSDSKIIAVVGATGAQGGGLCRAILSDPESGFAVRALTRNPDSDKARALAEQGAEVVRADVDDESSLLQAFDGAWGAFCVTFFWDHFSPDRETASIRNMASAAQSAGLRHVVWSTLEDSRTFIPLDDGRMPTLGEGRFKVPHFDAKGAGDRFFEEAGVPTTYLLTTYYWDNLIHFGGHPQRGDDRRLVFVLPVGDKKLPGIASEDIGKAAYGIFRKGEEMVGRRIGVAGEHLTGREMALALADALGEPVSHFSPPFDVYRAFDFPGADDLGNMFQFYHDFNDHFRSTRDVEVTRELNPEVQSFREWLAAHGSELPIEPR
ncbi:MAG: NmrA/HSCARG family protein [Gemmatimonadetes bacterium]|nr:NmrA/HSCARG family protein [Gemmatimonadota bacterium]